MKKPWIVTFLFLLVICGGLFGWNGLEIAKKIEKGKSYRPPPVTISTAVAKETTWRPYLKSIGVLGAANGVDISSELPGNITALLYDSGQHVEKNQLLIKIDDRIEQATLKDNQAELTLAQLNYKRQSNLFKQKATSSSDLDQAQAQLRKAEAQVQKTQTLIDQKNITAPFSGKLGIGHINVGQYISAGTRLISLQALSPLQADFSLPEKYFTKFYTGQDVTITVDAYPNETFAAKVVAIDSTVKKDTHNIMLRALIPNEDKKLYPGMFAEVTLFLRGKKRAITVPETAISYSLYGDAVYLIKQDGVDENKQPILIAQRNFVKTGEHFSGQVEVTEGISAGEEIVASGQLKLDKNTRVVINNEKK